jgi:hypothetical protein
VQRLEAAVLVNSRLQNLPAIHSLLKTAVIELQDISFLVIQFDVTCRQVVLVRVTLLPRCTGRMSYTAYPACPAYPRSIGHEIGHEWYEYFPLAYLEGPIWTILPCRSLSARLAPRRNAPHMHRIASTGVVHLPSLSLGTLARCQSCSVSSSHFPLFLQQVTSGHSYVSSIAVTVSVQPGKVESAISLIWGLAWRSRSGTK